MAELATTKVNRGWMLKMLVVLAVGLVLGAWGLLDATLWYPARGREDASYKHKRYLELSQQNGTLLNSGFADPRAALADLEKREGELTKAAERAATLEASNSGKAEVVALFPQLVSYAALQWLSAESLVGGLTPERTNPKEPGTLLRELQEKWKKTDPPKALAKHDLPLQWLIAACGFALAGWMLLVVMRAAGVKYRFDEATHTLHLPDGKTIAPGDIKEFDKRKWDKFFLTLHLRDGSAHKLDLLRNAGLEEWCLAMEKIAFPEQAGAGEKPAAAASDVAATG